MFDLFKKEIKVSDRVKLFLTTGKEPEGEVLEIGDNFVLLSGEDGSKQRYFEKLIGGWNLVGSVVKKKQQKEIEQPDLRAAPAVKSDGPFNKEFVIREIRNSIKNTAEEILESNIEPNSFIIKRQKGGYLARCTDYAEVLILEERILSDILKEQLSGLKNGKEIPVLAIIKGQKRGKGVATVAVQPQKVKFLLRSMMIFIELNYPEGAYRIFPLFRSTEVFKTNGKLISAEFKKLKIEDTNAQEEAHLNVDATNEEKKSEKEIVRKTEIEINKLIQQGNIEEALLEIDSHLKTELPPKYRSSFLLKKAQLFSSLNKPQQSEQVYQELIQFNKKTGAPPNNISHLYTELGRLQSTDVNKLPLAVASLKKAIAINPKNSLAENLLNKIELRLGKVETPKITDPTQEINRDEEGLIIDYQEEQNTISELIAIDLEEHKFLHPEVVSNDNKPTPTIAKNILKQAKELRKGDLSDRYPMYLEAAKAYSKLNVGSYDFNEYYEAVAYYSMLKGNSIFINFRNRVLKKDIELRSLSRLKDSACSYFLEALNLFSNIDPELLLGILNNYLKISIVYYFVSTDGKEDLDVLFKGQFAKTFDFCIKNKDKEIEKIAYRAIIDCGASSISVWNQLTTLPEGTQRLYGEFGDPEKRKKIYQLIEEIEGIQFDQNLSAKQFLKEVFISRRNRISKFQNQFSFVRRIEFTPINFKELKKSWDNLDHFNHLDTDKEVKEGIDQIIAKLQPYLNRNEKERINILIQNRQIVERTLEMIRQHTTYFGRVLYFNLLRNWKTQIDRLLEEKISASYPKLAVIIDPPYLIKREDEAELLMLVRNIGDSTSSGFTLVIIIENIDKNEKLEHEVSSRVEIPADGQEQLTLLIPVTSSATTKALEAKFIISPIYLDQVLPAETYEFTLEFEPEATLLYDDIPWQDGPIPEEKMFKGRRKIIRDLADHYLFAERDKPYIIYGLTRTGKSSILKYLRKELHGERIRVQKKEKRITTFFWDFSIAASNNSAADFYYYILFECIYEELLDQGPEFEIEANELQIKDRVRFKDFNKILEWLDQKLLYPVIFVDEFSFVKDLIDGKVINSAFLQSLRQYSLNGLVSFVFAGTFDTKQLVKDSRYGITGQFVHAIEMHIHEIKPEYAEELITVISDQLAFTSEAIEHIKFLSGNVPYFIQVICKNCAYYAVENRRRFIGFPELEKVIQILIGTQTENPKSNIKKIPEGKFQNNQFNPQDPKEVPALISTIAYLNKDNLNPRGISLAELEKFWGEMQLSSFRPRLSDAIMTLKERKILMQSEDEGLPVYRLSVDLFRRWWMAHHPDIILELNTLKEE